MEAALPVPGAVCLLWEMMERHHNPEENWREQARHQTTARQAWKYLQQEHRKKQIF